MKKSSTFTRNMVLAGIISMTLMFALILTSCRNVLGDNDDNPPDPLVMEELSDYLNSLSANTAVNPHTVALAASVTIDTTDTNPNGVWATINRTIKNAKRYVILDLSACSAANNTITGDWEPPTNNHFNIIKDNIYVKGIKLPSTLTSIGMYAFSGCTGLTSVIIPGNVTSIGWSVFFLCTSLTSVTIPQSVTSIEMFAFALCTGLTAVTIPGNVANIGNQVFALCTGLTSVTIPSSVTSIENSAFYQCASLTSVTIPNSVTSIRDDAFSGCTSLTSVTIPGSVTSIGYGAFSGCASLTSVTIPSSVTSIGDFAFFRCTSLTSVTIPSSVTSIGDNAFFMCTGLTNVIFEIGSNITSWGSSGDLKGSSLRTAYYVGGKAGTYTYNGSTWTQTL
jgi:hypothetical protein